MTRRFAPDPVDPELLEGLLSTALVAPSAGGSHGVDLIVLEAEPDRRRFLEVTTDAAWRERPGGSAGGLLPAAAVVVPVARASPYVARYAEPDKLGSGLAGVAAEDWAVPYWLVDASFVTMQLLLLVESVGLGALFHRLHNDPAPWLAAIGAPDDCLVIGAVTLGVPLGPPLAGDDRGVPAASPDLRSPDEGVRHRSPLRRARSWRTAAERIHRSTW